MSAFVSIGKKQTSIKDFCKYFDETVKNGNGTVEKFVGLQYRDGRLEIHFPVGYRKSAAADNKTLDKLLRKDILNLINVLSAYGKKEELIFRQDCFAQTAYLRFPVNSYIYIIMDFMNHGYYKQKKTYYKCEHDGKVNWSRTIKQIRPSVIKNNVCYFQFITKQNRYHEDSLFAKIHHFCVYECFMKLGCVFCSYIPEKPVIKLNKKLFIAIIKSKIANTFNESELLLFKNMLNVVQFLDEQNDKKNFIYGTNNFHAVWEYLVDKVYGESDKEKFYPKVFWRLKGSAGTFDCNVHSDRHNLLRPDTIMITHRGKPEQRIYVLDSKYYRYGATKQPYNLPDSNSIVKQIAYANYIDRNKNKIPGDVAGFAESKTIFNAFIMPADNSLPENIGYASADFVLSDDNGKPYYRIQGILLDIKTLMYHHEKHNTEAITELAAIIDSGI